MFRRVEGLPPSVNSSFQHGGDAMKTYRFSLNVLLWLLLSLPPRVRNAFKKILRDTYVHTLARFVYVKVFRLHHNHS